MVRIGNLVSGVLTFTLTMAFVGEENWLMALVNIALVVGNIFMFVKLGDLS
jgi:hypothetical protein